MALLKLTVPKFASGRTPLPLDGASAITSAEASLALRYVFVVENVHPWEASEMTNLKEPLPLVVTLADMESPGWTGLLRLTGYFGYISYHA